MLETKCVSDNYKILVTVLAILITSIHDLITLTSSTNKDVTNIHKSTQTLSHQHHDVTNITVTIECESVTGITRNQ